TWPADYPFEGAAGGRQGQGVEGLETIKLFVTERPADFSFVAQPGARSRQVSPLSLLLQSVFHGSAARSLSRSPVGEEDWTTIARTFVVRKTVGGLSGRHRLMP